MTDGDAAIAAALASLGLTHILCIWHILSKNVAKNMQKIMSAEGFEKLKGLLWDFALQEDATTIPKIFAEWQVIVDYINSNMKRGNRVYDKDMSTGNSFNASMVRGDAVDAMSANVYWAVCTACNFWRVVNRPYGPQEKFVCGDLSSWDVKHSVCGTKSEDELNESTADEVVESVDFTCIAQTSEATQEVNNIPQCRVAWINSLFRKRNLWARRLICFSLGATTKSSRTTQRVESENAQLDQLATRQMSIVDLHAVYDFRLRRLSKDFQELSQKMLHRVFTKRLLDIDYLQQALEDLQLTHFAFTSSTNQARLRSNYSVETLSAAESVVSFDGTLMWTTVDQRPTFFEPPAVHGTEPLPCVFKVSRSFRNQTDASVAQTSRIATVWTKREGSQYVIVQVFCSCCYPRFMGMPCRHLFCICLCPTTPFRDAFIAQLANLFDYTWFVHLNRADVMRKKLEGEAVFLPAQYSPLNKEVSSPSFSASIRRAAEAAGTERASCFH